VNDKHHEQQLVSRAQKQYKQPKRTKFNDVAAATSLERKQGGIRSNNYIITNITNSHSSNNMRGKGKAVSASSN